MAGLFSLQLVDLGLIGCDDAGVGGVEDARQDLVDLLFAFSDFAISSVAHLFGLIFAQVPGVTEHGGDEADQALGGLQALDHVADLIFDLIALDGFAVVLARFGLAEVIVVVAAIAFGDGRTQRHATARAADHPAQGKLRADIGAFGRIGRPFAALLHLVEGFKRDQPVVLGFEPVDAVALGTDVPGVNGLGQDIGHALRFDLTMFVARKVWEALKEALYFSLRAEPPGGKALKRLFDDSVKGRIRDEHFATAFDCDVLEADRGRVNPVTGLHTGLHLLPDLPSVLLALQRALRSDDGFDELPFGRVVELEVQAFDTGVAFAKGIPQVEEGPCVTARPLQVVKDDSEVFTGLRVEERQQGDHAGALHEATAACDGVRKDSDDLEPLGFRKVTTPALLTFEPMPI